MALQLRRGTNAERLAMTPVNGELIFVTDYELVTTSVTSINTTTETLTTTAAHGLSVNQQVKYIGATLNGLTKDQVYFVKTAPTITTFTLSTTSGGSTLNITGSFTVDLVFAKTPTTAAGVPLGEGVAVLWIGDGATVGGVNAASLTLDDLVDVVITDPVTEGEFLWYDGTNWINTNEPTIDTNAKTLNLTRRSTTAVQNYESAPAIILTNRVTDATNDNTDDAGPALRFNRSSGTQSTKTYVSGGAIAAFTVTLNNVTGLVVGNKVTGTGLPAGNGALITVIAGNQLTLDTAFTVQAAGTYTIGEPVAFGQVSMEYFGTTDVHKFRVTTTTDNFLESPADTYPGTYVLIDSSKNATNINQGVLYVDAVNDRVGINNTSPSYELHVNSSEAGPNDNVQFALSNSERTLLLSNNAFDDLLSFNYNGANRLQFDTTNAWFNSGRLGVNNSTPLYTLDVNGTANIETSLTVPSISTLTGDDLNITAFSGKNINITATNGADQGGITLTATTCTDPVTIVRTTAATGTTGTTRTLTLRADSTGVPVIGYGNTLEFETESTPGTYVRGGYIENKSTGDNAGVLDEFEMNFGLMSAGVSTERMSLDNLGNLQIDGDLAVNGGDITTTQTTGNLFNATATTVNIGNGATVEVNLGLIGSGRVQIKSPTIVGANTTQTVFNTVATTVNAFGASTATAIGSTVSGTTTIGYNATIGNNLTVTGGNIDRATAGQGNIFNVNATDINIGNGATTSVRIGAPGGSSTVEIKPGTIVGAATTQAVFNTIATTVNAFGATSTALNMGHINGLTTVAGALTTNITLQTPSSDTVTSGNISVGSAITLFTTPAVNTCTLPDGNNGQFKTLVRTGASNSMTVTVTTAGWKFGASGTISFGDRGDSCFLQFISGWGWTVLGAGQGGQQPVFS